MAPCLWQVVTTVSARRYGRATEVQRPARAIEYDLHRVIVVVLGFRFDRRTQCRHGRGFMTRQQARDLPDIGWRQERRITLDVDHNLLIAPTKSIGHLGNTVRPRMMIAMRHGHFGTETSCSISDTLIIRRNHHLSRRTRDSTLVNML
jgi:hypothetical protein